MCRMEGLTVDRAYDRLNIENRLDVALLEQYVLSAFLSQDNAQRSFSEAVLVRVRDHERAWERVDVMYVQSQHNETKFFALQILQNMIRTHWRTLDVTQRAAVRDFLLSTIASLTASPETYADRHLIVGKLNVTLVEILKLEWPVEWPRFIPDLVDASKTNEIVCQNSMCILQLLSEEVFDYAADQYSKRQARTLQDAMRDEFGLVFEMCMYVLSQSTHSALLLATLKTLSGFLQWVEEEYIYDTTLIHKLLTMCLHTNSDASHRLPALECLCEIASLRLRHPLHYHTQDLPSDEHTNSDSNTTDNYLDNNTHTNYIDNDTYTPPKLYEVPSDKLRIALYLQLVPQLAQYLPQTEESVGVDVAARARRREVYAEWYYQSQETQDFGRAMALFVTSYLSNNLCLYEQPTPAPPPPPTDDAPATSTDTSTQHRSQEEKHAQLLGGLHMLTKLCWLPDDTDSTTLTVVLEFFARLLSDALPSDRSECGAEQPRLQVHRDLYTGVVGELLSVLTECIPVTETSHNNTISATRAELKIDPAVDWIEHSSAACIRVLQRIAHSDADRDKNRRQSGGHSVGTPTRGSFTSTQSHTYDGDGEVRADEAEVKDRNFYIARDLVGMIAYAYPEMTQTMLLNQLGEVVKAPPTDASMTALRRVCQCIESIGTEGQPAIAHQEQLISSTLSILHPYTTISSAPHNPHDTTHAAQQQHRVHASVLGMHADTTESAGITARWALTYRCVFVGVVMAHAPAIQRSRDMVAMVIRLLFEWIYESPSQHEPNTDSNKSRHSSSFGKDCCEVEGESADVMCEGFEKLCSYEGVQKALTASDADVSVRTLVTSIDSVAAQLSIPNQRRIYNGVAILIGCLHVEIEHTATLARALLLGRNNTWQRLMNEPRATDTSVLRELLSVLAVNQAVCEPLGQAFDPQFQQIFPECVNVYRTLGTSGLTTPYHSDTSDYKLAVQRAILLLVRTYMTATPRDDYTHMRDHIIIPILQVVLHLYRDTAQDHHVLLLLVHVSTVLKSSIQGMLGFICDNAITPTFARLQKDPTTLPDHQEPLYKLMHTHLIYCFTGVLSLQESYQSLYFENLLLGMRSLKFRVSELSCQAIRHSLTQATDLIKGLPGTPRDASAHSAAVFLQKYYFAVLKTALDVLLDVALESRFFDMCALLSMMIRALTRDQLPALVSEPEAMSNAMESPRDVVAANTAATKDEIATHLLSRHGRLLQRTQALHFCDRVFLDFSNVRALGFVIKDLSKAIKSSETELTPGEETVHI